MSQSKGSSVYRQGKDGPFPEVSYARMYSYGNGVQPGYLARFRSRVPNIVQRRLIEARPREESSLSMPTARKSPWVLTGEAYLGKGSFVSTHALMTCACIVLCVVRAACTKQSGQTQTKLWR